MKLLPDCYPVVTQVLHVGSLRTESSAYPEVPPKVEYTLTERGHSLVTERTQGAGYCYCTLRHHMSVPAYFHQAEKARAACAEKGIAEDEDAESMYFISTLPWLRYTSMIQPVAGGDESNPRITWGKYEQTSDDKVLMPVSILAHHALVDGAQIAEFYQNLHTEMLKLNAVQ